MKLTYGVKDRPETSKLIVFALQQLLAILAATITVPAVIGHGMSASAALLGAGVGTLVYLCFTKFKSPVFLGSSFAFLGPMGAAFTGAVSMGNEKLGFLGLIIGAVMAGLVYVIISLVVKGFGVKWINKIMPAVVIGPTVAIIGLSLSSNAVCNSFGKSVQIWSTVTNSFLYHMGLNEILCIICALVTLGVVIVSSVYGKKMAKMIPFILGIAAGYVVATIFTVIGIVTGNASFEIINFAAFKEMTWIPAFTFVEGFGEFDALTPEYLGSLAIAYIPVAFVVFAEHIADHKNLSSIIEKDLLEDPGLSNTLLGDGVGSMAGAFFGGCPNTTYGESVGCVAISGNASVRTIFVTAIMAIVVAFIAPFTTLLASIPTCVMGGVCIALYGFIAVSGLKMIQNIDLGENNNLFVVSTILITGVGGMVMEFGNGQSPVKISAVACALILGIVVNLIVNKKKKA